MLAQVDNDAGTVCLQDQMKEGGDLLRGSRGLRRRMFGNVKKYREELSNEAWKNVRGLAVSRGRVGINVITKKCPKPT